jgi:DNA-directed RNA polymerase specialized sigma24 family protein
MLRPELAYELVRTREWSIPLVEQCKAWIMSGASRVAIDYHAREDVTAEVLLALYKQPPSLDVASSFPGYLGQMAYRQALKTKKSGAKEEQEKQALLEQLAQRVLPTRDDRSAERLASRTRDAVEKWLRDELVARLDLLQRLFAIPGPDDDVLGIEVDALKGHTQHLRKLRNCLRRAADLDHAPWRTDLSSGIKQLRKTLVRLQVLSETDRTVLMLSRRREPRCAVDGPTCTLVWNDHTTEARAVDYSATGAAFVATPTKDGVPSSLVEIVAPAGRTVSATVVNSTELAGAGELQVRLGLRVRDGLGGIVAE